MKSAAHALLGLALLLSACGRLGYDPIARDVDAGDLGVEIMDGDIDATLDLSVDMRNVDVPTFDANRDAGDMGETVVAGITVTPTSGLTTSETGSTATFTVVLISVPSASVTVGLTSSDVDEGTVSPASLTFTDLNWNAPQTVTVTGVDDALIDGNQTYTIVTAAAVSTDPEYSGRNAMDVSVTNVDNESAGVTLNRTSGLETTEAGGTDTFTIVLNVAPTEDVTIPLSSDTPLEATVSPSELVFTSANWSSAQTVTVTGVDDFVQDGNAPFAIVTGDAVSDDSEYMDLDVPDVTGLNHDDETPAIVVDPTSGLTTTEAGGTATFTVVLQSEPMADVTIPIASTDTGEGTVPSFMLTFTATNWNVPQAITVTGVDDAMADGDQLYEVTVGPATSTDAGYNGLIGDDVSVTNTDDESAGFDVTPMSGLITTEGGSTATFTVVLRSLPSASVVFDATSTNLAEGTVAPATLTFTTGNWNTPQTVTVTGVDDAVADGDQAYQAIVHVASSADADYAALSDKHVEVSNTDNETAGITVNPTMGLVTTEGGGTATFTVVLNSEPTDDVEISFSSDVPLEGTVFPASVTFTNANWDESQTITITGVDDAVADGSRVYHIVTADAVSTDVNYANHDVQDVTVTNTDNDSVGVTVSPSSGLTTSETGSFASFTIALNSQPTANVTINLSSSDTTEGTVSPASVTFTMGNWMTAQSVTVTGADDLLADGDVLYSVVTSSAISADSAYNSFNPTDVSVTNTDNDMASVIVSPTSGLVTTEAAATATFTVVLSAEPTSPVTISLTSGDVTEGTVSPTSLMFTSVNWNAPQTVTVTGVDDAIVDGDIAYSIVTGAAVSGDSAYSSLAVADVSITNSDNDTASAVVTPTLGLVTSEAGGTATFTVVLTSQPLANVSISLTSSNLLEGTVSPASLTFTMGNWNVAQTVTVTGVDDALADGNIAYTVTTGAATSTDPSYSGLAVTDVAVTNNDNDAPGVTINPTAGLVTTEAGATATFTVVLASMPTAGVTISLMSSDTTEGTVSPASVAFTTGNWDAPQTVTITGVNDSIDDGDIAYSIVTGNAASTDPGYSGRVVTDVSVTNTDNDTAGVTVTPTSGLVVTEAGSMATFTIALVSQPTADVTIALTSSDTTEGTVSPASLTFTSMNWNMTQTVTVTGVNDSIDDGDVAYSIQTGAAASADGTYSGMVVSDVTVTTTDNDATGITVTPTAGLVTTEALGTDTFTIVLASQPTADVTISLTSSNVLEGTVAPASVTFTSMNWNMAQTVTVTGVNDSADDGDIAYNIITGGASSTDTTYSGFVVADVAVTNTDNDAAGITVTPTSGLVTTEALGTDSFAIVLTSQPTASVSISLMSSNTAEGTVAPASVSFTTMNWNVAQIVTVTGVNDFIDDGNASYTIVTGAASSSDTNYNGRAVADVSVTNTDDDATGITVTPTSGLTTTEAGATATFTIVLTSQPTADVTISLTSSDSTEGTVSPASVTFTNANWGSTQTVTITGADDAADDGDIAYSIITGAASSTDATYGGRAVSDVSVTNTDNDAVGVTVTPTSGLVTSEAGGLATFTIVLNSQPSANVTIAIASSNVLEGTVSPASVTFMMGNWNVAQTVTVTGVDDVIADGNIAYTITTGAAVSADLAYNTMAVSDVSVTNNDNDVPGVTINPTSGLTTTEAGGMASFTVVLASMPSAGVTIAISSSNVLEGTVSTASVAFTTMNWNMAQTVTVTGVNDSVDDGDVAYTVVTGAAVSTDPGYSGLAVSDVSVTNTDNDSSGVTVTPTSGLVTTEALGTDSFTIVLTSQPTASVSISLMSNDTTEGTVGPASVTFTTMNWNMAQTVTVTGVNDFLDDGDISYSIVTGAASSTDGTYNGLAVSDVSVSNTDNDAAGVTVTPTSGLVTTELLGTDTFTIVLTSQPSADVTIALTSNDTTEGTVSPASVTFTSMNWNMAQTVTVTGVNDFLDDGDIAYSIVTGAASSSDGGYNGRAVADVSVTNTDNDAASVTVTPTSGLVTTEAGGTATFTIVLDSQPTADVSISLMSSNTSEGTVSPASVTFTNVNWSTPQTITLTGVNDNVIDGNQNYTITTGNASSSDGAYNGLVVADVSATNAHGSVYIKASNTGASDRFGGAIAFSSDGTTLVVGARGEASNATGINGDQSNNTASNLGAVYVFTRTGSTWTQQAYIKASNTGLDSFGHALALSTDGNTLVVGAYAEASNATGIGGNQFDNSANASGAAYVFTRSGSTWTQQAYIKASNTGTGDNFALAVSLAGDGNTLAVGAYLEASNATGIGGDQNDNSVSNAGATYVFTRSGSVWTQQAYIKASNTGVDDRFGQALAVAGDGDTLVVGSPREASNANTIDGNQSDNSSANAGAAYVFTRSGGVWTQQAYLKASTSGASHYFGSSIAASSNGNTVCVGAYFAGGATGRVYVFTRSGSTWSEQAALAGPVADSDVFGISVALSSNGNIAAIGAYYEASNATGIGGNHTNNSSSQAGAVFMFARSGTVWSQTAYVKASNTDAGDQFGTSVALTSTGSMLAVGTPIERSNATGINGTQTDNSLMQAGAVYIY